MRAAPITQHDPDLRVNHKRGLNLQSAGGPLQSFGVLFLVVFLFLSYSRLSDTILAESSLIFMTSIVGLAISFGTGGAIRALRSRTGIWLSAFTVWLVLAIPFSFWRGGSYELLREFWIKSFLVFFIVAGLPLTMRHCRMAAYTIGVATATIIIRALLFADGGADRLILPQGVLSNANSLAQFVLMGLPFIWLIGWQTTAGAFRRILAVAFIIGGCLVIAKTGSRGGLTAIIFLVVLVAAKLSLWNKLKLVAALAVIAAIVIPSLSDAQRMRYMTLFGDTSGQSDEVQQSAIASREQRLELLKLSVRYTFENPLLGVGPGVFEAYAADEAGREGRRTGWQVSHNMYAQISAEVGLPALIFYLGALGGCLKATRRLYKRGNGNDEKLAYALFLSLIGFAATAVFDSVAYQIYFPTLAGLTVALVHAVSAERARAPRVAEPLAAINPDYRIRQMAPKPPLPA